MNTLPASDPRNFDEHFTSPAWLDAARSITDAHRVPHSHIERAPSSDHAVFLIDDKFVLKIFRPSRNCFEREKKALEFARGRLTFKTPEIIETGSFEDLEYMLMTQIPGSPLTRAEFLKLPRNEQISILTNLADGLKQIHDIDPECFADDWAAFIDDRADTFIARQIAHGVTRQIIDALSVFLKEHLPNVPRTPTVFLHGDVHFGNLRFESVGGELRISGLFDFSDSRRGFHEYDLLAVGVLMIQGQRELQREFFRAYGYAESDMNEEMRDRLMMLTMLYETSDLRRYALRLSPEAVDYTLDELKRAIWSFV
jgi:aminoglycoside phosphotransferase (APT) family kinase protein